MRVVVNIVVEEEGGFTGALRYSHPHVSMWGGSVVVTATGDPPPEVGGQPVHCVVSECGVRESSEKCCVVDRVKGLGNVQGHGHCAVWW